MSPVWNSLPFWTVARRVERTGQPDATLLSVYREWGVVRKSDRDDNFNKPSEDLSTYKIVQEGDLVLNKMKTWQGSLGVSPFNGIVSPAYFVCELSDAVHGKFVHHLLRSRWAVAQFLANSKGIRPNQWDLPYDVLRQMPLPMPDYAEQRRIADFLDDRVACLDRIIGLRVTQVRLFSELSAAQAGAKISELTAQRGSVALRRVCAGVTQGSSPPSVDREPSLGDPGVLKTSAIHQGNFDPSRIKMVAGEVTSEANRIYSGDLLVTRGSGSADLVGDAAIAIVPRGARMYLPDLIYRIEAPRVDGEFLVGCLLAPDARSQLRSLVRQGSGPAKARGDDLLAIRVPAIGEDLAIRLGVEWSAERRGVQSRTDAMNRSVRLLTEYKQSLITAAVMGEFDVTTASTQIPGEHA